MPAMIRYLEYWATAALIFRSDDKQKVRWKSNTAMLVKNSWPIVKYVWGDQIVWGCMSLCLRTSTNYPLNCVRRLINIDDNEKLDRRWERILRSPI
ncbi:hypothetical protein TNCV_532381 [Trichonephila clavipes]|nr:hypothetical protein TNCV_532381 [Trichonephila clavipes]